MRRYRSRYNPSRTSPRENRKACLCKNGNTYSRKCCKGNVINQGIGSIYGEAELGAETWYGYVIESCDDQHTHHVHVHDNPLEVGKTYFFTLENGHNECYTVTAEKQSEGIHTNSVSVAYASCAECQAANP